MFPYILKSFMLHLLKGLLEALKNLKMIRLFCPIMSLLSSQRIPLDSSLKERVNLMKNLFDLYIEITTKAFPFLLLISLGIYGYTKYLSLKKAKKQD